MRNSHNIINFITFFFYKLRIKENIQKQKIFLYKFSFTFHICVCIIFDVFPSETRWTHNRHQVYCEEDIVLQVCRYKQQESPFFGRFFSSVVISPHSRYFLLVYFPLQCKKTEL